MLHLGTIHLSRSWCLIACFVQKNTQNKCVQCVQRQNVEYVRRTYNPVSCIYNPVSCIYVSSNRKNCPSCYFAIIQGGRLFVPLQILLFFDLAKKSFCIIEIRKLSSNFPNFADESFHHSRLWVLFRRSTRNNHKEAKCILFNAVNFPVSTKKYFLKFCKLFKLN